MLGGLSYQTQQKIKRLREEKARREAEEAALDDAATVNLEGTHATATTATSANLGGSQGKKKAEALNMNPFDRSLRVERARERSRTDSDTSSGHSTPTTVSSKSKGRFGLFGRRKTNAAGEPERTPSQALIPASRTNSAAPSVPALLATSRTNSTAPSRRGLVDDNPKLLSVFSTVGGRPVVRTPSGQSQPPAVLRTPQFGAARPPARPIAKRTETAETQPEEMGPTDTDARSVSIASETLPVTPAASVPERVFSESVASAMSTTPSAAPALDLRPLRPPRSLSTRWLRLLKFLTKQLPNDAATFSTTRRYALQQFSRGFSLDQFALDIYASVALKVPSTTPEQVIQLLLQLRLHQLHPHSDNTPEEATLLRNIDTFSKRTEELNLVEMYWIQAYKKLNGESLLQLPVERALLKRLLPSEDDSVWDDPSGAAEPLRILHYNSTFTHQLLWQISFDQIAFEVHEGSFFNESGAIPWELLGLKQLGLDAIHAISAQSSVSDATHLPTRAEKIKFHSGSALKYVPRNQHHVRGPLQSIADGFFLCIVLFDFWLSVPRDEYRNVLGQFHRILTPPKGTTPGGHLQMLLFDVEFVGKDPRAGAFYEKMTEGMTQAGRDPRSSRAVMPLLKEVGFRNIKYSVLALDRRLELSDLFVRFLEMRVANQYGAGFLDDELEGMNYAVMVIAEA